MSDMKLYGSSGEFYLAKHPDYPLIELSENYPHVRTTVKTKQKHIKEVLGDDAFLDELVKLGCVERSDLVDALEENTVNTRPNDCLYGRHIGSKVYAALGGYDNPVRSTFGFWFVGAQLLALTQGIIVSAAMGFTHVPDNLFVTFGIPFIVYNLLVTSAGAVHALDVLRKTRRGELVETA